MNGILVFLESITLLSVVKVLIVLLLMVYSVFALLMMKQISAMTRAVMMRDDFVIRFLGILHFALAVLTLLVALTVL